VEAEPFSETFGPKSQRKRPRIDANSFEEFGKIGAAAMEEALEAGTTVEGKEAKKLFFSVFINSLR
jgi:nuclear GTP-binding protein